MTVMFNELFCIVWDKINKSQKSGAATAYDSDSQSDSDEHEVARKIITGYWCELDSWCLAFQTKYYDPFIIG